MTRYFLVDKCCAMNQKISVLKIYLLNIIYEGNTQLSNLLSLVKKMVCLKKQSHSITIKRYCFSVQSVWKHSLFSGLKISYTCVSIKKRKGLQKVPTTEFTLLTTAIQYNTLIMYRYNSINIEKKRMTHSKKYVKVPVKNSMYIDIRNVPMHLCSANGSDVPYDCSLRYFYLRTL